MTIHRKHFTVSGRKKGRTFNDTGKFKWGNHRDEWLKLHGKNRTVRTGEE